MLINFSLYFNFLRLSRETLELKTLFFFSVIQMGATVNPNYRNISLCLPPNI